MVFRMAEVPRSHIHTVKDAELFDHSLAEEVDWESFYAQGKRTPPFLRNVPDENLVRYVELGRIRTDRYTKRERCRRVSATRKIDCEAY